MATSTLGNGTLVLAGTTSGTTTVTATAVAGTTTLTLPAATDTLVGKATTDTLTNKTLTGAVMNGTLGATTPSTVAATTISASSTATFAAGAAGTPSITTSGDTNTGIFFPAADTIAFAEGGVEAMRLDSAGNMGLGVTPSAFLSTWKVFQIGYTGSLATQTATNIISLDSNRYQNTSNQSIYIQNGYASSYYQYLGQHVWQTAASGTAGNAITFTQAMTLDASGNLLVGTTTAQGGTSTFAVDGNVKPVLAINNTNSISQSDQSIRFVRNGSTVGTISTTLSATAYNTSSDYRLKNTIAPMTGSLAKVAALKPVTYKWNVDGSDGEGFIAHELAEVCPQAVTGEKDAVDADGNPKYQGIDTSFLVATLTAAIQEQQALITQLTARITALESA